MFVDVSEMRRLETLRKDFVANVSHELRTPITAVRSAVETLRLTLERDPGASDRFVDIIDRNAQRLGALVEDLLDLSRIESKEYRPEVAPVQLRAVADQVLSLLRPRIEEKSFDVANEIPADLPTARADRKALEQVFTNLLDNAVKYCGPGTQVRLRARRRGALLRVEIADTGPGIEPRHLPRLFERFYRVDSGRSRDMGGTGLGLSIVKHLVEAMNGTHRRRQHARPRRHLLVHAASYLVARRDPIDLISEISFRRSAAILSPIRHTAVSRPWQGSRFLVTCRRPSARSERSSIPG